MTYAKGIATLAAAGLLVSGCSTKPRNFSASLSAPVADRMVFENDFRTCQTLVRQGHRSNFKGAAASALAGGAGAFGAGTALYSAGALGISGGGAAAAAAMPIIGIALGFGVSRAIRSGKERKYKRSMDACLTEYGYSISSWTKVKKRDDAAQIAASGASLAEPARVEPVATVEMAKPSVTPASMIVEQ